MKYNEKMKQYIGKNGKLCESSFGILFLVGDEFQNEWKLVGVDEDFAHFEKVGNHTYFAIERINLCESAKILTPNIKEAKEVKIK